MGKNLKESNLGQPFVKMETGLKLMNLPVEISRAFSRFKEATQPAIVRSCGVCPVLPRFCAWSIENSRAFSSPDWTV